MDHSTAGSGSYQEQESSSPTVTTALLVPGDSTEPAFEAPSIELPVELPLSHQVFRDPGFDPDQFLLSRRHTALEDLRTELRSYLAGLKSELVGLINEDYEDFIGLGMGLRGTVERAMGKMKAPIAQAKEDVLEARRELEGERADLEGLLNERRKVIEGKKLVRLMLDCGDSVTKVEEMLSIQQPSPLATQSHGTSNSLSTLHRSGSKHRKSQLSLSLTDESSNIESGVKKIERITSEYTRMLYLVSKGGGLTYVTSLQPRITRITDALHRELASLLKSILRAPRSDTRKKDCLLECLRAYESLGAVTRAEEVIKNEVVLPRMSKLIHPNVLDTGALSPVLPVSSEVARFTISHPPPHLNPSQNSLRLPEDPELIPLPMLYNKILAFIAREMGTIIDVADRHLAGSKQTTEGQPGPVEDNPSASKETSGEKSSAQSHYNVLVNAAILPTLQLITNSLGSSLFAAGNPSTFHRNYSYTVKFLGQLEEFCSTPRQVLSLRAHPDWRAFRNKWQLAVYAQIRTKEMILTIEDGLLDGLKAPDPVPIITPAPSTNGHNPNSKSVYLLKGSATIDHVLHSIWQDDVFLTDLTHRFWRLTLMGISRYATWLNSVIGSYINPPTTGTENGKGNGSKSRISTDMNRLAAPSTARTSLTRPNSPSSDMSEESKDEELLRILTIVLADLLRLQLSILNLFSNSIAPRIPRVSIGPDSQTPQEVLKVSLNKIVGMAPQLTTEIRSTLVKRCSEKLRFIRSVGSTARAAKTIPTEPSYFISDILSDVKVYLEKHGKNLAEEVRTELVSGIIDELSGKYLAILINVQRSEDSLRKLKKGKHGFSIFNRNSASESAKTVPLVEDDELKVKVQLKLDVERLELDSIRLGADLSSSKSFLELKQTVDK